MQTTLIHDSILLDQPSLNAQPVGMLRGEEQLDILANNNGFLHVACGNGRTGYVPAALCGAEAFPPVAGALRETLLTQPVKLYAQPTPGGQFLTAPDGNSFTWMVMQDEPLQVLGRSGDFVLVQRPAGQIGYVPAMLSRETLDPTGSRGERVVEIITWMGLGFFWLLLVWTGVYTWLTRLFFITEAVRPFLGLGLVVACVAGFWLSRRRALARPFAVGVVVAYGLLHLVSQGSATFWR